MKRALFLSVAVLAFAAALSDAVACEDVDLHAAVTEIDNRCPCALAETRRGYRQCVNAALVDMQYAGQISSDCAAAAAPYGTQSICGRRNAFVCCMASPEETRHRVRRRAGQCVDRGDFTACVSPHNSPVTGCDAFGCRLAECGNAIVEDGEGCDPPSGLQCEEECQLCDVLEDNCGNGTVDPGEQCEPPGAGSCDRLCQAAQCPPPAAGETDVACAEGQTAVTAAASANGSLLAWRSVFRRERTEILARRLHTDATPANDTLTVVSSEVSCGATNSLPSVASDASGYYVAWRTAGPNVVSTAPYMEGWNGRRVGTSSGMGATDFGQTSFSVGSCRGAVAAPLSAATVGPSLFAFSHHVVVNCGNNFPAGRFVDVGSSPPVTSSFALGYGISAPPANYAGPAALASLSNSTLAVWDGVFVSDFSSPYIPFVGGRWADGTTVSPQWNLSSRTTDLGVRPAVAAGASSFLVAWGDSPDSGATSSTELRAIRVTRAAGRIDADGGFLLASVPAGITAGPSAAFDGTRWLVAWTEKSGSTNDLRAVAVETDGTVIDATSRLVASDVAASEPALASSGNGKVTVAFVRQQSGLTAIRAVAVVP